ncbi:MAG: TRAP transporter substrate-binding protein [Fretibacterium sp.]|nr:TRAP transporter substrate-binding protein [Fretibacterium sp.]
MKKVLFVLMVLAVAAAAPCAGAERVLRWNEVNGETYGATVAAHAFADKLATLSGGALKIELYTNGTLGSEAESMQGIQMGTLDIFRGNASSLPNYGAKVIGATGLPYVFRDMAHFQEVAVSPLGDELLQSVADANCGYIALGWLVEGPRSLFITPDVYKKLGEPASFSFNMMSGLKIRVPETDLMVNTMKALKASATPIAYAELYTSLQSGVVDGAENGVTSYMDNSFNEVAPYFITDAHTFGCGVILVSTDTWNSLSDEEKGWMKEAALTARTACYEYNQKQEKSCFDSFAAKGIKLLPVSDIAEWQKACAPLYEQQSEEIQKIIARIQGGKY